ncbi:sialoadhesin-like [Epinephelus fuscoguttatus]|uniref:sialoadhesin-like n=1 Tax=Epinephelus fuscoguttatus TaxID=293821 RepID=UPI0020D037FD|nr:sialoadhesin-like [Epinephelus fuscoguttatus]
MSLTAAASGFVVFLLSVQVIQGQDDWGVTYTSTEICAVKGSTVDIRCSYTYPSRTNGYYTKVDKKFWFTIEHVDLKKDSSYKGRVEYHFNMNYCTLRIRDLRESDSAEYKFRFTTNHPNAYTGSPGVTLSVTDPDLQVQVSRSHYYSRQLKCHSSCVLPHNTYYIWYKNGQKIGERTYSSYSGYIDSAGSYSCALRGYEKFSSPSVYGPKLPSVSVSPSAEIVEGSSVTLTCSSDANPAAKYTWYKKTVNPRRLSEEPQLVFSSIQSSDSGEYYCTAENQLGRRTSNDFTMDVKYAPKLPSVSVSPSAEIVEGSSVTLTCSSDANPAATYTWYKENQTLYHGEKGIYHFISISSEDRGTYHCKSQNQHGQMNSSSLFLDVQYAPKLPSVSVSPSAEVVEGSSVTLTCSSDANPAANYTWYKENQTLHCGPENIYLFRSVSLKDSGLYHCKSENEYGKNNSTAVHIDVQYAPKLPSVSVSPSAEIVEGSSVTLTCSSDANPAANYTWYKENQTLHHGPENIYPFPNISLKDSGIYHCKSENKYGKNNSKAVHIDVQYAPKLPSVSVSPSAEIVEGSSVTLTCSSDANPAAKYTWYKWYVNLHPPSEEPQLVFSSIQSSDSGQYYCTAENELGRRRSNDFTMDVKYAPRVPSVSVNPSGKIMEGSSVTLTCSSDANPAAKKTWYMENQKVLQESDGVYQFMSISSEDRGKYYCTSENQHGRINSSSIFIDVQYAPKLPSVSVSPSAEIVEGSSVTLTCSSDANPAANYTWYKKTINPRCLSEGSQLVFSSIQSSDSGQYYCTAENELGRRTSNDFTMDVKYAPRVPSVSVNPSGKIMEGSSVTLTCSSDANPAAKKTWYMENQKVLQGSDGVYQFMSISSEDRGKYYCTSENQHGRINSSSIFIDVQYAPKLPSVSVSPSAEIVEGSSVTLTCSSDANPAAKYTWYKDGNPRSLSEEPQLVFSSIQSSDSGQYYCTAENKLGRRTSDYISMNVKYAPKLSPVSVSPSPDVKEGSSVTLTCSSDANPAAKYTWYKSGNLRPLSEEPQLVFSSIQSSDSGRYYCTAQNELRTSTSGSISISVKYAPKLSPVSVSPSGEIRENSDLTLTCSSDANPAATYTWYKKNRNPGLSPSKQTRNIQSFRNQLKLVLRSIRSSDSGQYFCTAENTVGKASSQSIFINVKYAPKLPSVSVSPSAEIVEGSSVTLTCSSDANPAANYTWYKEDEDSPKASGQIFTISNVTAEHSGNYYCEAQNTRGRHNSTSHLAVVAGSWILITAATVSAVVLAIILISVFLWIMKKRASKHPSGETPDTREQLQLAEQPNELHYATVRFSKNPAQPRRYVEAENVVYAVVKCDNASLASRSDQEAVEDPAALYSTVNKKRNP